MRKLFVASALLLATLPSFADTTSDLIAREQKVFAAIRTSDKAAFEALVSKDALSVEGTSGLTSVTLFLDGWKDMKLESIDASNFKVITLNPEAAVVYSKVTQKGTFQGQAFPPVVHSTTTWVKRKGKWTAVFHQESVAP